MLDQATRRTAGHRTLAAPGVDLHGHSRAPHRGGVQAARPDVSAPRTVALLLLNLGTIAVFIAWLAVACYALAYLISR